MSSHIGHPTPINEKRGYLLDVDTSPRRSPAPVSPHVYHSPSPAPPPNFAYPSPSLHRDYIHPPRHARLCAAVRPWLPLLAYLSTSAGFLVAIAFWRTELFAGLDELSSWLKNDRYGPAVMFSLIFLTTIPPLPLYSTLIVLSGYTFGAFHGALISYASALLGAIFVFLLSRHFLSRTISRWLSSMRALKRVVRAIERRPHLLFLIRLAPYPYNVMNCLLAAAPTLSFKTYTLCTALSLLKVGIHTTVGASLRSFAHSHSQAQAQDVEEEKSKLGTWWTVIGVGLCIGIVMYLAVVARRAVDDELGDEYDEREGANESDEEAVSLLSAVSDEEEDTEAGPAPALTPMSERSRSPVVAAGRLV